MPKQVIENFYFLMFNHLLLFFLVFSFCSAAVRGQDTKIDPTFPNRKLDSTFFYHKEQLKIAQRNHQPSYLGLRHWELGAFYFKVGVYSEAMDQFKMALHNLNNPKDTLAVVVKNSIGQVELSLKNFDQAEIYFGEALQEAILLNYIRGQAISRGHLGSCFEKKGQYGKALGYQNESLELFRSIADKNGLSKANENIGSIYEDLERYEKAHEYFTSAYEHVEGTNSELEANVLNNLGDIYRKKGSYQKAVYYTTEALKIANYLRAQQQLSSANKDLAKTYAALGDFQKAYLHLQEAERLNEEVFYSRNTNQFNVLQTVYETDKKEAKIKFLVQENELTKIRQNLLSVILFSGLSIAFGLYFYMVKRRKTKIRVQAYEKRLLETELEKKAIEEENLQEQIQLKTAALSKYSLHLSKKSKILQNLSATLKNIADRKNMDIPTKLKVLAKDIDHGLKYEQEWNEFVNYFSNIHPEFVKKLSNYPKEKLSPAEMRLGILLRLNLSSKEIASILRVTPDSIRVARHRLRKKLHIEHKEGLIHFLLSL